MHIPKHTIQKGGLPCHCGLRSWIARLWQSKRCRVQQAFMVDCCTRPQMCADYCAAHQRSERGLMLFLCHFFRLSIVYQCRIQTTSSITVDGMLVAGKAFKIGCQVAFHWHGASTWCVDTVEPRVLKGTPLQGLFWHWTPDGVVIGFGS